MLAAVIASMHTYFLWHHPYVAIILIGEALFVGLLLRRQRQNLLLLDGIYWLCISIPLSFQHILLNLLVAIILFPVLIMMVADSHRITGDIENSITNALTTTAQNLITDLNYQQQDYINTLATNDLPNKVIKGKTIYLAQSIIREIKTLIGNFKLTVFALNEKFREIQISNQTLEQKVAERTAALSTEISKQVKNAFAKWQKILTKFFR